MSFFRILRGDWSESKKIYEAGGGEVSEGMPPPPASSMFLLSLWKACYLGYARLVITVCQYCVSNNVIRSYFTFGLISMVMNSLKLACGFKECSFFSRVTNH